MSYWLTWSESCHVGWSIFLYTENKSRVRHFTWLLDNSVRLWTKKNNGSHCVRTSLLPIKMRVSFILKLVLREFLSPRFFFFGGGGEEVGAEKLSAMDILVKLISMKNRTTSTHVQDLPSVPGSPPLLDTCRVKPNPAELSLLSWRVRRWLMGGAFSVELKNINHKTRDVDRPIWHVILTESIHDFHVIL